MSEYCFEQASESLRKGIDMTVLDDRHLIDWYAGAPAGERAPVRRRGTAASRHPGRVRPRVAPVRYTRGGIAVSQAPHFRRAVSTKVTIALAALAALTTLWLGSLADFSGGRVAARPPIPDQLAVVRVQAGENLQHLAGRVAPGAPVAEVVDRIRDLNKLESSAVDAGETLIAPIG